MTEADAAASAAEAAEEAEARGYVGDADPRDRDEYALTSGPDSPGLEAQLEAKKAEIDAQLEEFKERAKARAEGAKAKVTERKAARASETKG
jgi:hypothetical protein